MEITNLRQTCGGCPTQYEGTIDGKWFYFRYRWGWLSLELWERPLFHGQEIYREDHQLGDEYDGVMGHDTALGHMARFVVNYAEAKRAGSLP